MATLNERPLSAHYDVLVIGAGINGAGVARDAAMRGLNVLLLDKGDIASGTSSASTRLIHGGLRYLEHAEFGLVRESLREREIVQRIAPHLVKPIEILLPIYRSSRRGRLKITSGMLLYDLLSRNKSSLRHRFLGPTETLQHAPGLMAEGLVGAAVYFDAQVEFAERLVVENVLSAVQNGASVRTHSMVNKLEIRSYEDVEVQFVDTFTEEQFTVSSSIVINAAGPWVDQVLGSATSKSPQLIGGTKGSHIVVGKFEGAPQIALYVEAEADQRPIFIIPWSGHYLIGTTDVRSSESPDAVNIGEDEIDYLLSETNRLFQRALLNRSSILFTFSGVRPLAFSKSQDEQRITRRHFIQESPNAPGLISIVGGKLTTYRKVAEQTVDLIAKKLEKPLPQSQTSELALPGATGISEIEVAFRMNSPFASKTTDRLLRIYGSRAQEIAQLATTDTSLNRVIDQESGGIAAEVLFAIKYEFAQTLSDVLVRRTLWAFNSRGGLDVAEDAAATCASLLGWSAERVNEELSTFRAEMMKKHHVRLPAE